MRTFDRMSADSTTVGPPQVARWEQPVQTASPPEAVRLRRALAGTGR